MADAVKTYVILDRAHAAVKIGISVEPKRRLRGLQTGHPIDLELIAEMEGDRERELHRTFRASRMRGEWFHLSDEVVRWMRQEFGVKIPTSPNLKRQCDPKAPLLVSVRQAKVEERIGSVEWECDVLSVDECVRRAAFNLIGDDGAGWGGMETEETDRAEDAAIAVWEFIEKWETECVGYRMDGVVLWFVLWRSAARMLRDALQLCDVLEAAGLGLGLALWSRESEDVAYLDDDEMLHASVADELGMVRWELVR